MHRYVALVCVILLIGFAQASRHELSSSLTIPISHEFGQASYNTISTTSFQTSDVKHLETLQHFTISTGGLYGDLSSHRFHSSNRHDLISSIQHTNINIDGVDIPHGTAIHMAFTAMNQEFKYHMEPMHGMISTNSKVEVHDENGVRETIPLKLQSYFLHTDDEWVSMTIHSDGTFSAVIRQRDEVYQIDPHHVHAEAMSSEHHYNTLAAASRHGMTIFRHSDLISTEDGGQKHMCGAVSQEGVAAHERGETIQQSHIHTHHQRSLLAVDPFNCGQPVGTSGYSGVSAGQVVDYGMYLRAGSATADPAQASVQKATDYVQSVYAMMNAVYAPQLLMILQVATVQVETTPDQTNKPWNVRPRVPGQRCELTNGALRPTGTTYSIQIDQTLTDFTAYVQANKVGTMTFWHQMTNCYPPSGVVGIAYVNVMCTRLRTGVSTFSTTTWLTMAHEIAHNFGADHTFQLGQGRTGGIMDYGLNTFRGEVQFNIIYSKTQLCGGITSIAADPRGVQRSQGGVTPYCFAALNAVATTTGSPTQQPTLPATPTTAPATVRPTPPTTTTTYTLAQVAQHRTATDCWVVIGTNVYQITRWNVAGKHPGGPIITSTCGTDATTVYNANHRRGASYLTQFLAGDVIGVLGTTTQPGPAVTAAPITPRPVTPVPTTAPATPPPNNTPPKDTNMYYWAVTPFSACSSDCEGQQTRMVVCVNGNNRNNLITVPDTFCANGAALNGARPASSQTCGKVCPVRFVAVPGQTTGTCQGTNGATCSTMAGTQGTKSQLVQCVKTQNGVDTVVADAVCLTAGVNKPTTTTACTLPTCTARYTWAYSAWSDCSTMCGGGTQTRRVACVSVAVDNQMKTILTIVQSTTCQSMFGNPPPSTQACNTVPCKSNSQRYVWTVTSNFTACSAPCNGGTQTRTAYCTDTYMNQVVPGYQCPNAPILLQGCNTQPCGVYVWITGRTGPCDQTCGPSTATRTVTCVNQMDPMMTPVATNLCLQSEKPSTTVPCSLAACPSGTTPIPNQPPSTTPTSSGLAVYALNTVATHAIPSDCWGVVNNLVYNLSYYGQDPIVPGISHPISGSFINGICGTDATIIFQQTHREGTLQLSTVTSRLIGKIGANTPDPVFPPPIGTGSFKWQIDQVGIQCGPTPVDKCTVTSASTPRCVHIAAKTLFPVDPIYCQNQLDPSKDPNQPRVGQPCPVDVNNPNPCVKRNVASTQHHILSSITSQQQHPLSRTMHVTQAVSGTGPQWLAGTPSDCSVICGGGSQVRNVTCIDGTTGVTLPSTSCDPTTKPDELLSCGLQSCSVFWSVGPWNGCTDKCGGMGLQTRSVDCRSAASSNGLGMIQPEEICAVTAPKPSTQQTCNAFPCPKWVGGTWSECSTQCGMGTQSLTGVRCENQYGMVVDDMECVTSSQFNHIRPCNMGPCPVYDHGPWSPCSATCGTGNQTREVYCRTPNHQSHEGSIEYNMTICDMYDGDGRAKGNHVTIQTCNEQPCDDLYWKIMGKSSCSKPCNGGALRVTSVCMKRMSDTTYTQVPDETCLNSTMLSKPTEILDCNTQPCSNQYGWDPSPWGECGAFCGNSTQSREVTCIDLVSKVLSPGKCSPNTQYSTTRVCSEPVNKCWGNVRIGDMKTGECITDPTNPLRGTCQCRSGWAGNDCSINPSITNVFFENTKYSMGIPVGVNEKIIIRWNSYGSNQDVNILLARDDNTTFYVQYIARNIVNSGVYEWNVGSILDDLPFANKYVIQVMMKNTVFGRSAHFQTADPCQYKACGMNAMCQAGKCQCQSGYTGLNCEISPCQRLGCDPLRSTCDNTAAAPTCKCADGWTGSRCKTPVSCLSVATCAHGGDYQHPVDMPISKPLTCPLDDTDVTCECQGYWTNTTCNVCGLQCANGGTANNDCSSCTCAPGYTGPTCACRYYNIKAKLNYDTTQWSSNTIATSTRRFQQTFANDIAASVVGLSSNQIIFTSFTPTSTNKQIDMEFQLTEQCGSIASDILMNEPRIAMAISGINPTQTNTLYDIYQQLLIQFRSMDSKLLQGYLTSSIVPGSIVVNDPTSTQQPEQPGLPQDPFGPAPTNNGVYARSASSSPLSIMLITIIVGVIVGIVLIIMGIVYYYKRTHQSSQHTLNKVTTELPSGTTSHSTTPTGAWEIQSTRT